MPAEILFPPNCQFRGGGPLVSSLMVGGIAGCVMHCAATCALCLSGGAALGKVGAQITRIAAKHVLPALFTFGSLALSFSTRINL